MKKMTVARFAAVLTAAFVAVAGFTVPTNVKAADSIEVTGGDTIRSPSTIKLDQYYDVHFDDTAYIGYFAFTTSDRADSTYSLKQYLLEKNVEESMKDRVHSSVIIIDEDGNMIGNVTKSYEVGEIASEKVSLSPDTTYYVQARYNCDHWDGYRFSAPYYISSTFKITENISSKSRAQMDRDKDDEDSDDKNTGDDTSASDGNDTNTDTDTDDADDEDDDEDDEDEIDYEALKDELSVSPSVIKGHKKNSKKIKVVTNEAVTKITYTSANKKIAKVTKNGKGKLLKKGKTKITVKFYCGDGDIVSAKVTVKVV